MDNNEMFVGIFWATAMTWCVYNVTSTFKSVILGMYENWEQRDERMKHEKEIIDMEFEKEKKDA